MDITMPRGRFVGCGAKNEASPYTRGAYLMDLKIQLLRDEVSTDKYWFSSIGRTAKDYYFRGETKKSYGNKGTYWNDSLCLSREFVENEPPSAIIDALVSLMRGVVADAIEHAIAAGDLKL